MAVLQSLESGVRENWPIWLVSAVLVLAAVIDGIKLKVPNWLTLPFIVTGWVFSAVWAAYQGESAWFGLLWSLTGTAVGLALLLPAYSIGGMGAGDVKLLMGLGAWVHGTITVYAFCASALVGAVMALLMVIARGRWFKHYAQFWMILGEIATVRNPSQLAERAAARKSTMMLLPYGIPIALGTILYFACAGLLV